MKPATDDLLETVQKMSESLAANEILYGRRPQKIIMTTAVYKRLKDQLSCGTPPEKEYSLVPMSSVLGVSCEHHPTSEECKIAALSYLDQKIPVMLLEE